MDEQARTLLGIGLYTIPDVARMTGVPMSSVRRWTLGYRWRGHATPPVVRPQIDRVDGTTVLTFRDMLELRVLHGFRKAGVRWAELHEAALEAKKLVEHDHPFSTGQFKSDGHRIVAELALRTGEKVLMELVRRQLVIRRVVAPYLKGVEFLKDEPARWFPEDGRRRTIVIDPARNFGQPVLRKEGVPTAILARAYRAEKSYLAVARWYEVGLDSVKAAVGYEKRLAAAA